MSIWACILAAIVLIAICSGVGFLLCCGIEEHPVITIIIATIILIGVLASEIHKDANPGIEPSGSISEVTVNYEGR